MRQGRKTKTDAPGPPPYVRRDDWDIDGVITLATNAVGNGMQWLAQKRPDFKLRKGQSSGAQAVSESYMLAGQLLAEYVGAAVKIAKESREALSDKNLKSVNQKQLTALLVAEVERDPELRAAVSAAIERQRAGLS